MSRTLRKLTLVLKDGKTPSRYGLACGYIDVREFDRDNRVTLEGAGACYHVKGYEGGKRFWYSFGVNELRKARECFRNIHCRMRYEAMKERVSHESE